MLQISDSLLFVLCYAWNVIIALQLIMNIFDLHLDTRLLVFYQYGNFQSVNYSLADTHLYNHIMEAIML